ncbi:MAG TPA: flagellar basal-body MS-ring/collar protein FliF, partial [Acetobacteraceae bacterium]|nr:flagellar basal-body MS-ring/collar protein FliF [Acetobacteraceae bacterium]
MTAMLAGLRALGPLRLGAMAAVALVCLGLLGFLAFRGGEGPMALLYADLDLREAGQVVEQLDKAHIARQIEAGGSRILVPADQVGRARLLLAKEGLPSGGSIGYEIFDRSDGLTANSFQQGISQTRALEGELARTIRTIQGVRAARVHLVLPRREPFARERQEAQASVVLTMAGAARLDREGVQSILNLISAAVPGLRPQNIAMVDSRGNLLARAGQPTGPAAAAQSGEELKRATELRLSRAVEEMLERSLGPGRVRAEAAVDLDFDQVRETQERFDPEGQVIRSQQNSTDSSRNTEAAPSVSVQNNLPNADAGAQATGSQ